jgi:hypothetical protein
MNKEFIFIYDPQKKEWRTIYLPINKKVGTSRNNKNTSPYTFTYQKRTKSNYQYKTTKTSKNKVKYNKNTWKLKD